MHPSSHCYAYYIKNGFFFNKIVCRLRKAAFCRTDEKMMTLSLLALGLIAVNSVGSVLLNVSGFATLRGTEESSSNTGRPFYAFRSVHYAEKPSNSTRFLVINVFVFFSHIESFQVLGNWKQPPVPKAPYPEGEIVSAIANNLGCTQPLGLGQEDCLTLNVFTPTLVAIRGDRG